MTTMLIMQEADSPTLKRSFPADISSNHPIPGKKIESSRPSHISHNHGRTIYPIRRRSSRDSEKRRKNSSQHTSSVSMQTGSRQFASPIPSFMSVFGEEANTRGLSEYNEHHAAENQRDGKHLKRPASNGTITHNNNAVTSNSAFSVFHQHRDSTSTSASESSDSSPTTTISTVDSSSMTEPSPGPSPESPHSKMSPSSFVADSMRLREMEKNQITPSAAPFFEMQRPTTPAKKARNLKGLAVNTLSASNLGKPLKSAALPQISTNETSSSAPTSPSFVKPPTPPKRRPSALGLTIQTPGHGSLSLAIPPTPSFKRPNMLRHFQSSPSLPLMSPSVAPEGGMKFPPLRVQKPPPHGFAEIPMEDEEEPEPNFDIPQSREEKPDSYPDGPIRIYESGVFLYFEPSAEVASQFDVIFNVASEVKNPYTVLESGESESKIDVEFERIQATMAPEMVQAPKIVDFAALPRVSIDESESQQSDTPTTPKATQVNETQAVRPATTAKPEYIHIPWEHNTDIVADLYTLVKSIDERVQKGKKVLVHCQCGVSRSASLIVAYGIYKNPDISVQEAYDAVKKRSKWIAPNMNLIMQLQEFRNGLLRQNGHSNVYGLGIPRSNLSSATAGSYPRSSPFDMEMSSGSRTPRTAPLPPENSDISPQRASTGNMGAISPGPLSAPSQFSFAPSAPSFRRSWGSSQTGFDLPPSPFPLTTETPYVDPKGHVVPILKVVQDPSPLESKMEDIPAAKKHTSPIPNFSRQLRLRRSQDENKDEDKVMTEAERPSLMSPRATEFSMTGIKDHELEDSFGLTSPRATEFNIPKLSFAARHVEVPAYGAPSFEPPLFSPRQEEFAMHGLQPSEETSDPFGLLSPTSMEFPKNPFENVASSPVSFYEAGSPTVESPASAEFHMAPLKHEDKDDDFGLTSPLTTEFPKDPFGQSFFGRNASPPRPEPEVSHPIAHIQSFAPPSNAITSAQPQAFGSLNFAPTTQPTVPRVLEPITTSSPPPPQPRRRAPSPPSPTPRKLRPSASHAHLNTPPQPRMLRPRFSSPNMAEKLRLHKLQTEIEATLPHRSPNLSPQSDASALEETLMSPRATEFTKNPFHLDLPTEVKKHDSHLQPLTLTTKEEEEKLKVDEDPRSPVLTGGSPITRSIWDVL